MVEKSLWCCTGRICWKSALWYLQELYPVECWEMLFVHSECLDGGTLLQDNLRRLRGTFLATGCYKLSCIGGPGEWGSHGAGEVGWFRNCLNPRSLAVEKLLILQKPAVKPIEIRQKNTFPCHVTLAPSTDKVYIVLAA